MTDVAAQTGAQLVVGSSLKAALDLNWDDPTERKQALEVILNTLDTVESELQKKTHAGDIKQARETLEVARQIQSQDVTLDTNGNPKLITGLRQKLSPNKP